MLSERISLFGKFDGFDGVVLVSRLTQKKTDNFVGPAVHSEAPFLLAGSQSRRYAQFLGEFPDSVYFMVLMVLRWSLFSPFRHETDRFRWSGVELRR
jgi:hypothetical protein